MKIVQEDIIAYVLDELEPERRTVVDELIRTDERWKAEYTKWAGTLSQVNTQKPSMKTYNDVPDRYWNTFIVRVHERIDDRKRRFERVRERIYHAVPSLGLAVLILFFLNNILISNKKLDYLVEQYSWIRSLNTSEVIDQYIQNNISAADDLIGDLLNSEDESSAVLADWEESYSPTETDTEDTELTADEQKALLDNLEKTTSF